MKKFVIVSFGCQMSFHDGEIIAQKLIEKGYDYLKGEDERNSDTEIIIFTTCAVRGHAEERLYSRVQNLKNRKKEGNLIIGVGGCLSQKEQNKLLKALPWVDFIFGTQAVSRIDSILDEVIETGKAYDEEWFIDGEYVPKSEENVDPDGLKAWVSIMKGCDNYCTYCIVPYVRGREFSRKPEDIIDEVKFLTQKGIQEITLLGQNVNSYGKKPAFGIDFPGLLDKIAGIDGISRIRFATSHPKDFSDELIHCIAKHDKICNQIHLPVQSGSTSVLKLMNRGYSREEYIEKALKIKKLIPDVALTTDIICGFPGETDEDFEQTLSLVQKIRYASAFTFYYSPRKGTAAYDMKDLLPEEARKKRLWNLIEIQKEITKQETAKRIGQIEKVMVDSIEKTGKYNWAGRSDHNRVVVFNSDQELYGKILDVEIESASSWTLFGKNK